MKYTVNKTLEWVIESENKETNKQEKNALWGKYAQEKRVWVKHDQENDQIEIYSRGSLVYISRENFLNIIEVLKAEKVI